MRRALIFLAFALSLQAQDAVQTALLVNEPAIDAAQLAKAIASNDALTRATAARVATVRGVTDSLPALREAVVTEANGEAVREQIRALVLLGGEDDVALAAKQLPKFPPSLDSEFAEAIARRGAPGATALYLKYLPTLRSPASGVTLALWGRSSMLTGTVSRLLGAKDHRAFATVLDEAIESNLEVDPNVIGAALNSEPAKIRTAAVWYLVERYAAEPSKLPADAGAPREGASVEEAFGREVLRRMSGAEIAERKDWLAWLKTDEGRRRVPNGKPVRRFLSLVEQQALEPEDVRRVPPSVSSAPSAPFTLPLTFPSGLGEKLIRHARCGEAWLGVAAAAVDRTGRVQSVDVSKMSASEGCKKIVEAMLRLSLAQPKTIASELASNAILLVKGENQSCFDEGPLHAGLTGAQRAGGEITPPKVRNRVEPGFPDKVRAEMSARGQRSVQVVADAIISKTGCVRNVQLVGQSEWPELNVSALLALAKWTFEPGKSDGEPTDVIFQLTMNFKVR